MQLLHNAGNLLSIFSYNNAFGIIMVLHLQALQCLWVLRGRSYFITKSPRGLVSSVTPYVDTIIAATP